MTDHKTVPSNPSQPIVITRTFVDIHLDGEHFVGRFISLSRGHCELEVVEPFRGCVEGHAYHSYLGGLAFSLGCLPPLIDERGEPTDCLEAELCDALRRWLPYARFFTEKREPLLAAKARIVARIRSRSAARNALDEQGYEAAVANLDAQAAAGLDYRTHNRLRFALELRRPVDWVIDETWTRRMVQHIQNCYGISVSAAQVREWLG